MIYSLKLLKRKIYTDEFMGIPSKWCDVAIYFKHFGLVFMDYNKSTYFALYEKKILIACRIALVPSVLNLHLYALP